MHMYSRQQDRDRHFENIADQIKKGTTTCALTCTDGVVLAADTRASAGFFIADRHVMKIQKVDRHLGMTIAGGVADAQNLVDIMRYNANIYRLTNRELMPIKSAQDCALTYCLTSDIFHTTCKLYLQGMIARWEDRYTISIYLDQ